MKTGYADFWELYRRGVLPGETKNYVPGIIAAAIMAKNPAQYGLEDLHPMPPVVYDTIETDAAVDLRLVADVTDVSTAEIVALNPSLLRSTTPRTRASICTFQRARKISTPIASRRYRWSIGPPGASVLCD